MFSQSVIQTSSGQQMQNHVSFLHEDLLKLPSFPRKALEAEFGLHQGEFGKEVAGLDMIHKYVWTRVSTCIYYSNYMFRESLYVYALRSSLPSFNWYGNSSWWPLYSEGCRAQSPMLETCLCSWTSSMAHYTYMEKTRLCYACVSRPSSTPPDTSNKSLLHLGKDICVFHTSLWA